MRARRSMTMVFKLLVHTYPGGWSPYSRTRIQVSIGATHVWVSGWIWVNMIYHHTKFEPNHLTSMSILKMLSVKQHSLDSLNVTQTYYQDLPLEPILLCINVILISWKSMQENESNKVCFMLTFWPPVTVKVTESCIKWLKSMVPISVAGMKKKLVEKFTR